MGCYCSAALFPPCGWCESENYICDNCGTETNYENELVAAIEDCLCSDCYAEVDRTSVPTTSKVEKCICKILDLMMIGCTCGGAERERNANN